MEVERFEIIDRKYKVKSVLGGGGFSDVYLVEGPDGPCALKLLKGELASLKKSALEEFKNEFSILKDMRHPHIAAILDFGFDEAIERYYYTSELIEGRDILNASRDLKLETVTDLFVQALRALGYIHSFRIYHFDVKAANVLVLKGREPSVKIIDFGLAGLDPKGRLIGTPSYMSPEIVARERADGRADLYSLGVLWYSCVTHKNPFRARNANETISRQQKLIPPPPSKVNPTLPKWLDSVIMRLLEKNPANRFPNAAAVIREINRLGEKAYPLETRETLLSYLPDEGRFVGREGELASLETDLDVMSQVEGMAGGCLVQGGLGTGKTRLLRELKYRAQLKDIRIEWASALEQEDFKSWSERLAMHLAEGKGLCAFILDDAQHALDGEVSRASLLALVSRARRPAATATAWIAISTRPLANEEVGASLAALLPSTVSMKPFTREELGDYIVSLTGLATPPQALIDGLYDRTEGNPLFLTELLRSLIEGGGLFDEHGRWNEAIFEDVGVDFSKAAIPGTVGGLLLERASSLSDEGRRMLEALAAAARPATAAELGRWTGNDNPGPIAMQLVSQGMLDRVEGFALRFHNALLGQVIYDAMPFGHRTALHDRMAADLKASGAAEEWVLEHASRGSDEQAAFDAAMELGERALKAGRGEEAAKFIGRALDLVDTADVEKCVEVQMKLGEAYLIGHDYTAATEHFSAVEATIASSAASPAMAKWRAEVLTRLGGTYIKLGQFERARTAFHDAKGALTQSGGDMKLDLTIQNFLGNIQFLEGNLEGARRTFTETDLAARVLPEEDSSKVTNNDLGVVLTALNELDDAEGVLARDLEVAQRLGDDLLIGRANYNLAQLWRARCDYRMAIESYRQCIEVCRRSHNIELLLRAYNGLGNAYQMIEDSDQSITFYERGMALHERTGDLRGGAAIAINMGLVESARKRPDAALDHLVPAVEYLRSIPEKTASDWAALSRGLLELGDIARGAGRLDEARMRLEEARGIATRIPQAAPQRFWIMATLAEVAQGQGRKGEVADLIGMLESVATSDQEKAAYEDLAKRLGAEPAATERSMGAASPAASAHSPYEKILEINKLISAENDLGYVLKTVLYYALELTGAEAGAILLAEEAGGISVAASQNLEGGGKEAALSLTLAKQAIDGAQPVSTDDAMSDERFAKEASVAAHSLRSILCMPMRARGSVIGALYLEHRHRTAAFAGADVKLLDAFTDQAGLAIETAKLLRQSAEKQRSLSSELEEASRKVERYEDIIKRRPGEFRFDYGMIAQRSAAMQEILSTLDKVADTDISVFIYGESGSGKELIARALHSNNSARSKGRFVAINCGAIPPTLIESELFGHKAGAFTGAARDKPGLLEEASGGTLFLDEVGELRTDLQVKLLRALQEGECTRIGETKPRSVDLRVITASNRDLEDLMAKGEFRQDLYYRICQMRIVVPPLRDRPEDLAFLVEHFVSEAAGDRALSVSPKLMRRLLEYDWPGNVRELENLIKVSCALVEGDVIDGRAIPTGHPLARASVARSGPVVGTATTAAAPSKVAAKGVMIDERNEYDPSKSWADYERVIMAKCLAANGFNVRDAAAELCVAATTLYKRIKSYGLGDRGGPSFTDPFVYARGRSVDDYLPLVFKAAHAAAKGRAKDAIANLRVSQGYFYKVIKGAKKSP